MPQVSSDEGLSKQYVGGPDVGVFDGLFVGTPVETGSNAPLDKHIRQPDLATLSSADQNSYAPAGTSTPPGPTVPL